MPFPSASSKALSLRHRGGQRCLHPIRESLGAVAPLRPAVTWEQSRKHQVHFGTGVPHIFLASLDNIVRLDSLVSHEVHSHSSIICHTCASLLRFSTCQTPRTVAHYFGAGSHVRCMFVCFVAFTGRKAQALPRVGTIKFRRQGNARVGKALA